MVKLRVSDICHADRISARTIVMQQKTQRPVQFEITDQTRAALAEWIKLSQLRSDDFVFPGHAQRSAHLSTRQYSRIVKAWVTEIGLDPSAYVAIAALTS